MRDAIIECSVQGLLRDGLRFSVDEVAKTLKISKKTVYKYFPAKEDLAAEIYDKFYGDALNKIEEIKATHSGKEAAELIIGVYFKSHVMVRKEIFNKYSLNAGIRNPAIVNHGKIRARVEELLTASDREALMVIIDGSLQKLCEKREEEKKVIERLVELICR